MNILKIANHNFSSRLFVGTGKYSSPLIMEKALTASGTEMVTLALRRVDLNNPEDNILNHLDRNKYLLLPNTSGAHNADEAIRLARLAKASGLSNWVKLEVTPEPKYLLPDGEETLKATIQLVKEGFVVLPYILPDPILAKKLEDAGASTVMPLASSIGSNRGIRARELIEIIIEQALIPVVVDAGLGSPSDAALAMEIGASAVLVNTAIASSKDPVTLATAFAYAVLAGRMAYEAKKNITGSTMAVSSSPLDWLIK